MAYLQLSPDMHRQNESNALTRPFIQVSIKIEKIMPASGYTVLTAVLASFATCAEALCAEALA
jgi:hypothetical protein